MSTNEPLSEGAGCPHLRTVAVLAYLCDYVSLQEDAPELEMDTGEEFGVGRDAVDAIRCECDLCLDCHQLCNFGTTDYNEMRKILGLLRYRDSLQNQLLRELLPNRKKGCLCEGCLEEMLSNPDAR